MSDRPDYLRPVPAGGSAAPAEQVDPSASETPGLTRPLGRGSSTMFITDVIVELGYASREIVDDAIDKARMAGRSPEVVLLENKVLDSEQLSRAMAERYGLRHVDLNAYHVDMGAANMLSPGAARRYKAVPVGYLDKDTLLLAMADPANVIAIDDVQMITGLGCEVAVAAEEDIEALILRLNTLETAVSEAIEEDEEEAEAPVTELRESAEDAPVIKLVYSILGQAVIRGRFGHPLRAGRRRDARPLPRGRRALRGGEGAAAHDRRRGQPREDHERHGHRREAGAAGRPRLGERRGSQGGPANHDPADPAGRGLHDPHPRQGPGAPDARRARHGRRSPRALRDLVPQALRGDPRHGPDGLRKVHVALRDAQGDQRRRAQHHHDRGPGRVPARRDQPDRRQPPRRPDVRRRACARSCEPTPT